MFPDGCSDAGSFSPWRAGVSQLPRVRVEDPSPTCLGTSSLLTVLGDASLGSSEGERWSLQGVPSDAALAPVGPPWDEHVLGVLRGPCSYWRGFPGMRIFPSMDSPRRGPCLLPQTPSALVALLSSRSILAL